MRVYPTSSWQLLFIFLKIKIKYCWFFIKSKTLKGTSKNSLFAIFSRLRRVVTRWIIASYNIAFSKLPLKTEVFRGSLKPASLGKLFFFRLVRQAALVHYAHFSVGLPPVVNRLRPFFCCFKSCKIQSFQQSLAAWEHTALALPVFGNWNSGFQSHSWCKWFSGYP